MSVTTFFRGRIGVKTEAGLSILSSHLFPWTREEDDECFVEFEDDGVMLCGDYRNHGVPHVMTYGRGGTSPYTTTFAGVVV